VEERREEWGSRERGRKNNARQILITTIQQNVVISFMFVPSVCATVKDVP
jgi:hypothetical protein